MGKKKRKIKKLKQKIKQLKAKLKLQQQQLDIYISKEIPQSNSDSVKSLNNRRQALLLDNKCSGKTSDRFND